MGIAFQVLLLVVAIVVAVAGIGIALALRLSARPQPARRVAARGAAGSTKAAPSVAAARAAVARAAASPVPPQNAHEARLAALQAMLALGDERAEREAESGGLQFADTQPVDDDYLSTQAIEPLRVPVARRR